MQNHNDQIDLRDVKFNTTRSSLSLGSLLTGFAAIIALPTGVFASIYLGGHILNSAPKVEHPYLAGDPAPIARDYEIPTLYHSIGGFGGAQMGFKFTRTKTGLDAYDSELYEKCVKSINGKSASDTLARGAAHFGPKGAREFLACSMSTQKRRFCDKQFRKRLAGRLSGYLKFKESFAKMMEQFKNSPMGKMTMMVEKASRDAGSSGIRKGSTTKLGLEPNLAASIRDLSNHGLLSEADFGNFLMRNIPKEIAPNLVEAKMDVCA